MPLFRVGLHTLKHRRRSRSALPGQWAKGHPRLLVAALIAVVLGAAAAIALFLIGVVILAVLAVVAGAALAPTGVPFVLGGAAVVASWAAGVLVSLGLAAVGGALALAHSAIMSAVLALVKHIVQVGLVAAARFGVGVLRALVHYVWDGEAEGTASP